MSASEIPRLHSGHPGRLAQLEFNGRLDTAGIPVRGSGVLHRRSGGTRMAMNLTLNTQNEKLENKLCSYWCTACVFARGCRVPWRRTTGGAWKKWQCVLVASRPWNDLATSLALPPAPRTPRQTLQILGPQVQRVEVVGGERWKGDDLFGGLVLSDPAVR